MTDDAQLKEAQRVAELLGITDEVSQVASEARVVCPLHPECAATNDYMTLNWQGRTYFCHCKGDTGSLKSLIKALESRRGTLAPMVPEESDAEDGGGDGVAGGAANTTSTHTASMAARAATHTHTRTHTTAAATTTTTARVCRYRSSAPPDL